MLLEKASSQQKTITKPFALYNTYGAEEKNAVLKVLDSGVLSQFVGAWCEDFYGGSEVLAFEERWKKFFKVKHAISVNSATSGLIAALGAIDIEPGDEVIVSPWTMSASATAILVWNAVPVFADIEERTFCLDPESIKSKISSRTKAIVVTDIFGHAARLKEIMEIAKKHNLIVIEDAAQAPGALYHDQFVGTIADIGIFSLNYHKHIHTGEGGVCVTNSEQLAQRMQLIRNHAESVVEGMKVSDIRNMVGFNFRLGEMEAALGSVQLAKLPQILVQRAELTALLFAELKSLPGLRLPVIEQDCTHVFYVVPFIIDRVKISISRTTILEALANEGLEGLAPGYTNVHLLPMYQQKTAYGSNQFPWSINPNSISYDKGICPVAERLHHYDYFSFLISKFNLTKEDIKLIARAFFAAWKKLKIIE
ncbi:MAG: DegT/DnrJ/EryC1/StrS family aminotransferase [Candidatus Berkiella sp.]